MKKAIAVLLAATLAVGCSSLQTTRAFNGMTVDHSSQAAHITGGVTGLYLLPVIPLIYSYSEGPVSAETAVNMVTREARNMGYTNISELESHYTSVWLIPTFVLWYKSVTVSCNATK